MPKEIRYKKKHRCSFSKEIKDSFSKLTTEQIAYIENQLDDFDRREKGLFTSVVTLTEEQSFSTYESPHRDSEKDYNKELSEESDVSEELDVFKQKESPTTNSQSQHENLVDKYSSESDGLEENILSILGYESKPVNVEGPPIHSAVQSRWMDVIINGLSDQVKMEITSKYLIPKNLRCIRVPILNPEVKAAMGSQVLRRDERIIKKQEQLSSCISAVGRALSLELSKKEDSDLELVHLLSDTGRLLCDFFHTEMCSRKELILINLNQEWKDILLNAPVDKYLFGEGLEDRLKIVKNLKPTPNPKNIKKAPEALNFLPPVKQKKKIWFKPRFQPGFQPQFQRFQRPPFLHQNQQNLHYQNSNFQARPRRDHHDLDRQLLKKINKIP